MLKVIQKKNLLTLLWLWCPTSTPRGLPAFLLGLSDGLDREKGGGHALGLSSTLYKNHSRPRPENSVYPKFSSWRRIEIG